MYPRSHLAMLPQPLTSRCRRLAARNPRLFVFGFLILLVTFLCNSKLFREQGYERIVENRNTVDRSTVSKTFQSEIGPFSARDGLDMSGSSANNIASEFEDKLDERMGPHNIANQLKEEADDDIVDDDGAGASAVNAMKNAIEREEFASPSTMSNSSVDTANAVIDSPITFTETGTKKTAETTLVNAVPQADSPSDSEKEVDVASTTDASAKTESEEASAYGDSIDATEKEVSVNNTNALLPNDLTKKQLGSILTNTTFSVAQAEVEPQDEIGTATRPDANPELMSVSEKEARERRTTVIAPIHEAFAIDNDTRSSLRGSADIETASGQSVTIGNAAQKREPVAASALNDENSKEEDIKSNTISEKVEEDNAADKSTFAPADSEKLELLSNGTKDLLITNEEAVTAPVSKKVFNSDGRELKVETGESGTNHVSSIEKQELVSQIGVDSEDNSEKHDTAMLEQATIGPVTDRSSASDAKEYDSVATVSKVEETIENETTKLTSSGDSIPINEHSDDADIDVEFPSNAVGNNELKSSERDFSDRTQSEEGEAKVAASERGVENMTVNNIEGEEGNE